MQQVEQVASERELLAELAARNLHLVVGSQSNVATGRLPTDVLLAGLAPDGGWEPARARGRCHEVAECRRDHPDPGRDPHRHRRPPARAPGRAAGPRARSGIGPMRRAGGPRAREAAMHR